MGEMASKSYEPARMAAGDIGRSVLPVETGGLFGSTLSDRAALFREATALPIPGTV